MHLSLSSNCDFLHESQIYLYELILFENFIILGEELSSLVTVILRIVIEMVIIGMMIIMIMISTMIIIILDLVAVRQDSYVSSVSEQSVSPTHLELIH